MPTTTEISTTLPQFLDWLNTFADTDALADWLNDHGVQGVPGSAHSCPIATLGSQMTSLTVTVGLTDIWLDDQRTHLLPTVAQEFIAEFDELLFPTLVKTGWDE